MISCRKIIFWFLLVFVMQFLYAHEQPEPKSGVVSNFLFNLVGKVHNLENQMKSYANEIQILNARYAKQKERLNDVEKQLVEGQKKKTGFPVGFTVVLTQRQSNPPSVIYFNKVTNNYGNGWNPVTHHFVAPKKGMYLFYLSFLNGWKMHTSAEIRRGNNRVTKSYTYGDSYNSGSCAAVLELQKGEHVSAWLMQGQLHKDSWAHFVGVLIYS